MSVRPVGIDVFAGAGGLSLGFEQAGFDVAAAVDVDPVHCAVHKYNFPDGAVITRSVEEVSGADIVRAAGLSGRRVDCVFGGAPCQGFSLIGHRALDDPRNRLVRDFVRLVSELNARFFVFENVRGLTVGNHRVFLAEIVEEFFRVGYKVRQPWRVLNAGYFGVPQFRERLILLGARKDETLPNYPSPLTNIAGRSRDIGLPEGPNCTEALGDLPDAEMYLELTASDEVAAQLGEASGYAGEMRCLNSADWHHSYVRRWNPDILTSSARTAHTGISRRRFRATRPGTVEPISRFFRLPATGVSNTLRAGTDGTRGAFTSPRPIHYAHDRCVTVREMARLHGFPDWFRFNVTKWHGARQIGNAVPPPLGRAIAEEVVKVMALKDLKARKAIDLGNPSLLSLGMSDAASYFQVEAPVNRRDRRSGARKRKQVDIELQRFVGRTEYG